MRLQRKCFGLIFLGYALGNLFGCRGYANMTWVDQDSHITESDGKQTGRLFLNEEIEPPLVFHVARWDPRCLSTPPKKVGPPRPLDSTPRILVEGEP